MREIPPTGANLREQASLTIECFQDKRLQFYSCEPLRRDLNKLRCEEKSYGFRLVSPRDGEGHGDTFSAFALALLVGHELAGKKPVVAGAVTEELHDPEAQQCIANFKGQFPGIPSDDLEWGLRHVRAELEARQYAAELNALPHSIERENLFWQAARQQHPDIFRH